MKKPLQRAVTSIDKTRYELDKQTNKAIKSIYSDIEKLTLRYDELTNKAEKTYEHEERTYLTLQKTMEASYDKQLLTLKTQHTVEQEESSKKITSIKQETKSLLEALKLDYRKSLLIIDHELDELSAEKTITVKEIEKKYRTNTTIFESKLKLFEKNLQKNKEETARKFQQTTEALTDVLATHQQAISPLFFAFENDVAQIEQNLSTILDHHKTALNEREKQFKNSLNKQRKLLNTHIKNISQSVNQVQSNLEAPFSVFHTLLLEYRTHALESLHEQTVAIDIDYKQGLSRLEQEKTPTDDQPLDTKKEKDIQAREKLLHLKADTLNKQQEIIATTIRKEYDLHKNTLDHHRQLIYDHLNRFENTFKHHTENFKDRLSALESHVQGALELTSDLENATHDATQFHQAKQLIKDVFSAMDGFEQRRLETHIDTLKQLLAIVIEVDSLTMHMDTVEARKEIEINQQKMIIEQQDASRRLDMRTAKLTYDRTIETIKHDTHKNEHAFTREINRAQATLEHQNMMAQQAHEERLLDIKHRETLAEAVFNIRKTHFENDRDLLDKRHRINLEKEQFEANIKRISIDNDLAIDLLEIGREMEEHTEQQTLEIKQHTQTLNLSFDKKRKITERANAQYQSEQKHINKNFEQQKRDLEKEKTASEKSLQDHLAFIDKAFERETEKPRSHIKEVNAMISHRLTLIKDNLAFVQRPLKETELALRDHNVDLKNLLVIVGKPFHKTLNQTINQWYETFEESHIFIADVMKKHIELEQLTPRKHQTALEKHTQDTERTKQKLAKQKATLIASLNSRLEEARRLVKAEKKPTFVALKQIIKPLHDLIYDKTALEAKQLSQTLKTMFIQIYRSDETLVSRAKENHKAAKAQALEASSVTINTFEDRLNALEDEKQQALQTLEKQHLETLNKQTDALEKSIQSNQRIIQEYQAQKNMIGEQYKDKESTRITEHKQAIEMLESSTKSALERLETQHTLKHQKIHARIEDAAQLFKHEKSLLNHELEHQENMLQEQIDKNHLDFEDIKRQKEQDLERLKQDTEQLVQKENDVLKKINTTFEEQSISSIPRLESLISEATRLIDEETTLKKQKITQLVDQSKTKQASLHTRLDELYQELTRTIDQHLDAFLAHATTDLDNNKQQLLQTMVETREHLVNDVIKEITKDIITRD